MQKSSGLVLVELLNYVENLEAGSLTCSTVLSLAIKSSLDGGGGPWEGEESTDMASSVFSASEYALLSIAPFVDMLSDLMQMQVLVMESRWEEGSVQLYCMYSTGAVRGPATPKPPYASHLRMSSHTCSTLSTSCKP